MSHEPYLCFCALTMIGPLLSMEDQRALGFHQKYQWFSAGGRSQLIQNSQRSTCVEQWLETSSHCVKFRENNVLKNPLPVGGKQVNIVFQIKCLVQ